MQRNNSADMWGLSLRAWNPGVHAPVFRRIEEGTSMARALCLTVVWLLSAVLWGSAQAATATLVSIPTPRGAKVSFILIKPDKPVAAVILFAGGHGGLGLKSASAMTWGAGNFLVRTR